MSTARASVAIPIPPRPKAPTPKPGKIPHDLRQRDQWVLWRFELREGKWTKTPIQIADPTSRASSTDPTTWGSFEDAVRVYQHNRKIVDGYGYVFSPDDPFVGCDFDNCLGQDGEVLDWVQQRISTFGNAYFEVSPSGRGLKGFIRGRISDNGKGRKKVGYGTDLRGAIEIYSQGRFFTTTGDAWYDEPDMATDFSEALQKLHAEVSAKKPRKASALKGPSLPLDLTDEVLLRRARESRNGPKFTALYDAGDTSQYASDESSADMALMNMLAFWTDKDSARMERLFSGSALGLREKWTDRPDYRQRTIEEAIAYVGDTYSARSNGRATVASQGPPTIPMRQHELPATQPASFPLTDLGNAERMVAQHGSDLRYCHPWKKFLVWDGKRFRIDNTAAVNRLAKATVRGVYKEAADPRLDSTDSKTIGKWAVTSESRDRMEAMIVLASREAGIPVLPDELDCDPWLLNCRNGTVDLRTGELRDHDRSDLLTKLAPVKFDASAECPNWLTTLQVVFDANQPLIRFWQQLCGIAITGVVTEQILPILYGKGSNGKSTLLNALLWMLGPDFAMKAPSDFLTARRNPAHPTDRADLFGMRLVLAVETGEGCRLDETLIKELTGSDPIRARKMREDHWQFDPTHKLMLCTNHQPVVKGTDHAIWRRPKMIPFTVTIPDDKQDKSLPEKLKAELAGILAWCVRGCLDWQLNGLCVPDEVKAATEKYRASQDILGGFIEEHCFTGRQYRSKASSLYSAYKDWAEKSGERVESQRTFGTAMTERGFERTKSSGIWYEGIGLIVARSAGDDT